MKAQSILGGPWGWITLIVVLLLVGFAQPAFLLLAWHFNIGPQVITAATDLGAIMGAVFTAGGLVVALVSIYTMANIDSVTRRAVESVLKQVPTQIDERITAYLEAYGYFTQAQAVQGWELLELQKIEMLVERAVSLQPTITGLYSWPARRFYAAAVLKRLPWVYPQSYSDGSAKIPKADLPQFIALALKWNEEAIRRRDGDESASLALLAELHAMLGDSISSVAKIIQRRDDVPDLIGSETTRLAFIFCCCRSARDVDDLASLLNLQLLTPHDVTTIIRARVADENVQGHDPGGFIDLLAYPLAANPHPPDAPGTVRIAYQRLGSEAIATWVTADQTPGAIVRRDGIPRFTLDPTGQPTAGTPIGTPIVLAQLFQEFRCIAIWDHATGYLGQWNYGQTLTRRGL